MRKIAVVGLGYVGLISAAVLAYFGHEVVGYDINEKKIDYLNKGLTPIQEPNLRELLFSQRERISFSANPSCLSHADAIMIAVDTPEGENGACNLSNFYDAIDIIMANVKNDFFLIIKSTVPPGTNDLVKKYVKNFPYNISVISNPEFLRQGQALSDMLRPERVVIGANEEKAFQFCYSLYEYYYREEIPVIFVSPETAELSKYASNAFLAVRLSYINEIANLCETVNADVDMVAKIMGLDSRIGPKYLNAGIGFGGSCLPKDVKAICNLASRKSVNMAVVKAAIATNDLQPKMFAGRIIDRFVGKSQNTTIAILGLSFKGATSDIRNSPSLLVVEMLLDAGFKIVAYDPFAATAFSNLVSKKHNFRIGYDLKDTISHANAVAILTNANEWASLSGTDYKKMMKIEPIIFDGKNLYILSEMKDVEYHSVGRPVKHIIK